MTTETVDRTESHPDQIARLMGRETTPMLPYEYEKAQKCLLKAEAVAWEEPDKAKRSIALVTVAHGYIELGKAYGWGTR